MVFLKTCLDCKVCLPTSNFHKKGMYWDSRCKPCALKQKKSKYVDKKRRKEHDYNNIKISFCDSIVDAKMNDLAFILESFLLEECIA